MDLPVKNKIRFIWNQIIECFNTNEQQDEQIEILKEEIKNLRSQFDLFNPVTEYYLVGKNDLKTDVMDFAFKSVSGLNGIYRMPYNTQINLENVDFVFFPTVKATPMSMYHTPYPNTPPTLQLNLYSVFPSYNVSTYSAGFSIYAISGRAFTAYVRFRYITASGTDNWIFILLDKQTKNILQTCSTKDPYMFNYNPFSSQFDITKNEIILVDKKTTEQLNIQKGKESFVELIDKHYIVDYKKEKNYIPLHSGKMIGEGDRKVKHMIKTLPENVKVRGLTLK